MRRSFAIAVAACVFSAGLLAGRGLSGDTSSDMAEPVSTYTWRLHDGWIGGFSGLDRSEDGREMVGGGGRGGGGGGRGGGGGVATTSNTTVTR